MKVKMKICNFTPDREYYRIEPFNEIKVEKIKKTKGKRKTEIEIEDAESVHAEHGKPTQLVSTVTEVKRNEPVYEFPKDEKQLRDYLSTLATRKLTGALGVIRKFFPSTSKKEGGVLGLKDAFDMAWVVRVEDVSDVGEIVPIGYRSVFQYKGGQGMGKQYFDRLTQFTLMANIRNAVLEKFYPQIFHESIDFLESAKLGRSGTIEILEKS